MTEGDVRIDFIALSERGQKFVSDLLLKACHFETKLTSQRKLYPAARELRTKYSRQIKQAHQSRFGSGSRGPQQCVPP